MENISIYDFGMNDCTRKCTCGKQGRIQDLVKGGAEYFWPIFADSAQRSHANKVFHH